MTIITSNSIILPENATTPDSPGASRRKLYVDNIGTLRLLNSAGAINQAPALPYLSSFPNIVGDGNHDDTAGIQAAINSVVAGGGNGIFVDPPPVAYKIVAVTEGSGVIPTIEMPANSNFTLQGFGYSSVFYCTGVAKENNSIQYTWFFLGNNARRITFDNLRFYGDNAPFEEVWQGQSAVIRAQTGINTRADEIKIINCTFENLWGLPVYLSTRGYRTRVSNNLFYQVGNGLVMANDYSQISHNIFWETEGIEATGHYLIVDGNHIINPPASGGISVGGRVHPSVWSDLVRVTNNTIVNSPGVAISVAEAGRDFQIIGNIVDGAGSLGIHVNTISAEANPSIRPLIALNTIRRAAEVGSAPGIAIRIGGAAVAARVLMNNIGDEDDADTMFGIDCTTANTEIAFNRIRTTNNPIRLRDGGSGTRIGPNDMVGTIILSGTGSIAPWNDSVIMGADCIPSPVITSPNGTRRRVLVGNDGALSTEAV